MKFFLFILPFIIASCSVSQDKEAQSAVKAYLKDNLKNPDTYEPLTFSRLDTLKMPDTSESNLITKYLISHTYSITNADHQNVRMKTQFYIDKDMKIINQYPKSINGDYGSLTGNAYWKYNDYVGNRPDAGAKATLFSMDSLRPGLKYETITDVQGNYKIDNILPGHYFLVVKSSNATDCPDYHVVNLDIYRDQIKSAFGFDFDIYKQNFATIKALNRKATAVLNEDTPGYDDTVKKLERYETIEAEMQGKADSLIQSFPIDFRGKIGLSTGYGKALFFKGLTIEEGRTENAVSDFGITCI